MRRNRNRKIWGKDDSRVKFTRENYTNKKGLTWFEMRVELGGASGSDDVLQSWQVRLA
jgi:hypothetical protein